MISDFERDVLVLRTNPNRYGIVCLFRFVLCNFFQVPCFALQFSFSFPFISSFLLSFLFVLARRLFSLLCLIFCGSVYSNFKIVKLFSISDS